MCTIILKRANGAKITLDQIYAALQYNSDGFGVMWYKDSKLVTYKYDNSQGKITDSADFIFKLINSLDEYAIHFRFATHGDTSKANCHPFTFDGRKRALMHNGVLPKAATLSDNGKITDTLGYIRKVLTTRLKKSKTINWQEIGHDITRWNKFVVAENGGFIIVNAESGVEHDGNWYSNYDAVPNDEYWSGNVTSLRPKIVQNAYGANYVSKNPAPIADFKRDLLNLLDIHSLIDGVDDIQDAELLDIVSGALGHNSAYECLDSDEYGDCYDTYNGMDYF